MRCSYSDRGIRPIRDGCANGARSRLCESSASLKRSEKCPLHFLNEHSDATLKTKEEEGAHTLTCDEARKRCRMAHRDLGNMSDPGP